MRVPAEDLERLERAVSLAAKGRFGVEPNPPVGCVLAREGRIVGEGWHADYGGPHAEVAALAAAGHEARGATAYVSLEPCSRTGKTGPCTRALAAAGVVRVVYAAADPSEEGAGHRDLLGLGLAVEGPACAAVGEVLLERFLAARERRRPWTILKWAMSVDGRIAATRGKRALLSSDRALAHVHAMRAHVDAVAVGAETVRVDDPLLTSRLPGGLAEGRAQPLRVVFGSRQGPAPAARVLAEARLVPTLLFVGGIERARRRALEAQGVEVEEVPGTGGRVDLSAALGRLRERGIGRLLVEGGARLHGALLARDLADQVSVFVTPWVLGGPDAPPAVTGTPFTEVGQAPRLVETTWRRLGEDLLLQGYVQARGGSGQRG